MTALYDSKSNLDDRQIKELFTERSKISSWLKVEAALAKAQGEIGIIPSEAALEIENKCKVENIDFNKMNKIKKNVGHGFVPFIKVLVDVCGDEAGKYVHYGVTTQNIQQTAQLSLLKQALNKIKSFVYDCLDNLADIAEEHAETVLPGRTHGKHAIPITYGFKVSVWISELLSSLERIEESEKRIFLVMMGGAVGSFNSLGSAGRKVQTRVAELLNMGEMDVSSRNMSIHKIEYISNLAMLCNTFHKIAEEVYYTGIEEFGEVSERFTPGTIGSSTMPQKINPKLSKGIIANSQKLYSIVPLGYFSSVRLFEGDSSSYMLFDGLLEEATELCTEVVIRAEELTRTLTVNKEKMLYNANLNKGLDNTENIMMKLAAKIGKDQAHQLMYEKAIQTEIQHQDYLSLLKNDPTISSLFTEDEIVQMTDPTNYIGEGASIAKEMASKARLMSKNHRISSI